MTGVFDDHLTVDTIVAFADGEMALVPYQRAATHVMSCPLCAADVAEQTGASQYLRQAPVPRMPGSLFNTLKSIPVALPQAGRIPGVVLDAAGFEPRLRPGWTPPRDHSAVGRARRFRMGAGALMAGLAAGTVGVVAGDQPGLSNGSLQPDAAAVSLPAPALRAIVVDVVARRTGTR